MSQGTNKPDLSDLKARLGLKKPSAAQPKPESQDSAQAVVERAAPASGPGVSGPPGGAPAGPPRGGPSPSGAPSGPPASAVPSRPPAASAPAPRPAAAPAARPVAAPRPAQQAPAAQKAKPRVAPEDIQLDSEDLAAAGGGTFSPMVIGLFVVLLLVGAGFGWAASTSLASSKLHSQQTADSARIHSALVPKFAEFDKANGMIEKLNPDAPDFKSAEALAALDFTVDSSIMGGSRLLLGAKIIGDLTGYTVESAMLSEMLDDHDKMTNTVDKKELEAILENNELLAKDRFAVLVDYKNLVNNGGKDSYSPSLGKLVNVTSNEKDEEGNIEVSYLNSDKTSKAPMTAIIPLRKDDLLKSSGPDALQRYKQRVERIKAFADRVDSRKRPLDSSLKTVASRDGDSSAEEAAAPAAPIEAAEES